MKPLSFRLIFFFGFGLAGLLILIASLKHFYLGGKIRIELMILVVGLVCGVLGYFISTRKSRIHPDVVQDLLSEREMEVLKMVEQGFSNKDLASKLFVSENTIKTHLKNIYVKLDANRRTEAVSKAKELGIL